MDAPRDPGAEELDALRRRLYRPGSTELDLRRYLAERSTVVPESLPEAAPAVPRARLHRLWPAATLSAVVLVALTLTLTLSRLPARPAAQAAARTATPVPVLVQDIGDGDTLAVPQRASVGAESAPVSVDGRAVVGQRFDGSGNAVLVVDPPHGSVPGGVATVQLTSGGPIPVAWRALSLVYRGRWIPVPVVLARGTSAEPPGVVAPQTFRYRDAPPTRIAVIAPQGVRWSVLVGVTGPKQGLR